MNRLIRQGQIRKSSEDRTAEFIISTETPDRHGTVIKSSAWNFDNYNKNPIVLFQHQADSAFTDYNPSNILGRGEVWQEGPNTIGKITFLPKEVNPKAEDIYQYVQHGVLNTASVGFMPLQGHWGESSKSEDPELYYFDRADLLEWSIVTIPSNPDAVKRSYEEAILNDLDEDWADIFAYEKDFEPLSNIDIQNILNAIQGNLDRKPRMSMQKAKAQIDLLKLLKK